MTHAQAVAHLVEQIQRNQAIAGRLAESPARVERSLLRLQDWQHQRLDRTYADLRQQDRYRPACEFFLDELYGGRDFCERDRQLARVVPVMRRFLPEHLLVAVGDAMCLQAISLEFDLDLAELLQDEPDLSQPIYARAYRQHAAWAQRQQQIDLIGSLGHLLDTTVHRPMVHRLVRMMHGPAVLAGFGALQQFLIRGLDACARMRGAELFLDTIVRRERQALEAMRSGSDWPFAEWIE